MWQVVKRWIAQYDAWCKSMGLTPEQKRSCVPYRKDPSKDVEINSVEARRIK